jgi:hypothetical protein
MPIIISPEEENAISCNLIQQNVINRMVTLITLEERVIQLESE